MFLCAAAGVGDLFVPYTAVLHETRLPAMERPEMRVRRIGRGFAAVAFGLFYGRLEPPLVESRAVLPTAFGIGKAGISVVPGLFPFPTPGRRERPTHAASDRGLDFCDRACGRRCGSWNRCRDSRHQHGGAFRGG